MIRIRDPGTDPDPDLILIAMLVKRGGMHCPSASSFRCIVTFWSNIATFSTTDTNRELL